MSKSSAALTLVQSPHGTNIQRTAAEAVSLQVKINNLNAELEPIKETLRDYAGGETETIAVPGKGKVSIAKPSAPGSKTVLKTDMDLFGALPAATQRRIIALSGGAISIAVEQTKASTARVTITPNV